MNPRNVAIAAVFYLASVALAEMTVGNESFPIHFWYFTSTPAWRWSIPVHALGFAWILSMNRLIRGSALRAALSSWTFFVLSESFNLVFLRCFQYAGNTAISLSIILVLYLALCVIMTLLLRRSAQRTGP